MRDFCNICNVKVENASGKNIAIVFCLLAFIAKQILIAPFNINKKLGHSDTLKFLLFFQEKNIVKLPKAVIKTSEYFKTLI